LLTCVYIVCATSPLSQEGYLDQHIQEDAGNVHGGVLAYHVQDTGFDPEHYKNKNPGSHVNYDTQASMKNWD
jgi:hypothetical protein